VVQPDALVGVGRGAVFPLQVGLDSRDETFIARHDSIFVAESLHSTRGLVTGARDG